MKTLIEIHVLQNFAPSNLNRDDTGAPKDAFFGGTRRARVSSQCGKRAVRQFFDEKMREGVFSADELAVRTKRVYQAIVDALAGKRDPVETLAKAEIALSYVKLKGADGGKTDSGIVLLRGNGGVGFADGGIAQRRGLAAARQKLERRQLHRRRVANAEVGLGQALDSRWIGYARPLSLQHAHRAVLANDLVINTR